jgi:hypothetical protein
LTRSMKTSATALDLWVREASEGCPEKAFHVLLCASGGHDVRNLIYAEGDEQVTFETVRKAARRSLQRTNGGNPHDP